jgi:hypothetical protein
MFYSRYENENLDENKSESSGITMLSPGGEDDNEDADWSDIDDEDFEDMAEDKDDFREMELDNDIYDPDDDDHLPDDDLG